ncbi:MAG: hypothetical protein LBI36_05205 [Oscillospiraceae bacterium]|jgi:hypothetical protein|nr:hypothetical protein [Oscillospiraceae bacterium]
MLNTIFAVPCDQLPVLTQEQGEELLEQINNKPPMTDEEKERLALNVKTLFKKPGKNDSHDRFLR